MTQMALTFASQAYFWHSMCEEESALMHVALKRMSEGGFLNKFIPNKFMMHFVIFSVKNLEWVLKGKLHI